MQKSLLTYFLLFIAWTVSASVAHEGSDYEGRTGVGATGTVTGFWYDANGNLGRDLSRGILETRYYPYGEPTIGPIGQRYLYGGKEREHTGGYNAYDFSARRLTPFVSWSSADPLATSFYPISPFSYCGGDPINRVDRDGRAWRLVESKEQYFMWVDNKYAYDKNGKLLPNHYEQAISFAPTDKKVSWADSDNRDFNIGSSIATIYKADGNTENFDACTVPSDPIAYAMIPEGFYEAKVGKHKDTYEALRLSDAGTQNFSNNSIELGRPNPSHKNVTKAFGINIHKAGIGNLTGFTWSRVPISQGCLLIDYYRWDEFISIFNTSSQKDNVVGIILYPRI